MKHESKDIVGNKYVKNSEECLSYDDTSKLTARRSHYKRMFNVEFMWVSHSLPNLESKVVPTLYILKKEMSKAIAKMKTAEVAGPSEVVVDMLRSVSKEIIKPVTNLANRSIKESCILSD